MTEANKFAHENTQTTTLVIEEIANESVGGTNHNDECQIVFIWTPLFMFVKPLA